MLNDDYFTSCLASSSLPLSLCLVYIFERNRSTTSSVAAVVGSSPAVWRMIYCQHNADIDLTFLNYPYFRDFLSKKMHSFFFLVLICF